MPDDERRSFAGGSAAQPDGAPERGERGRTQLYRRIMLILNGGFLLSVGLMVAGMGVAVIRGQTIGDTAEPVVEVLPAIGRLRAQAFIDLGILVLMLTPVAYVAVSLSTFVRHRDALFVGVSVALLLIVGGSVGMALT